MQVALSIPFSELRSDVSFRLGYGRKVADRDSDRGMSVDAVVRQGLREFYYNSAHEWSFLKPNFDMRVWASASGTIAVVDDNGVEATITATARVFYPTMTGHWLTLSDDSAEHEILRVDNIDKDPSDQDSKVIVINSKDRDGGDLKAAKDDKFTVPSDGNFDLPTDFHALNGLLTYGPNEGWAAIARSSEESIRRLRMSNTSAGKPMVSAVRVKAFDSELGHRSELMLHPKPDGNYTLSGNYTIVPLMSDEDKHFPMGGMVHAETIRISCLAKAEFEFDQQRGSYAQEYQSRLQASIRSDMETAPATLGRSSDGEHYDPTRHSSTGLTYSYNGVET